MSNLLYYYQMNKKDLWDNFIKNHGILEKNIPLFDSENLIIKTVDIGLNKKKILKRSPAMEKMVISEVNKVIDDFNNKSEVYDGLIYMMYKKSDNDIIPLYIGKSEKYGKNNNLSSNIKNIEKNSDKFCRWGYNYSYHIGDLSAVVCPNHDKSKINNKYQKWAKSLFKNNFSETPELNEIVYLWMKAWGKDEINIWQEYGSAKVTFLEYLMIGIASELFPNDLLNIEGVNR